ncbi:hypothetical protein SAMN05192562_102108 [Kosakonia arachidis]|uniref:Uncharacterized protein n=1 Tax=Kosakonia arachidis TaxID=551989 RepID=A0A1I7AVF5_9ENTR|nr:hypothetical protein SAMN05192562_102108 [Kosakonia arachidis]
MFSQQNFRRFAGERQKQTCQENMRLMQKYAGLK